MQSHSNTKPVLGQNGMGRLIRLTTLWFAMTGEALLDDRRWTTVRRGGDRAVGEPGDLLSQERRRISESGGTSSADYLPGAHADFTEDTNEFGNPISMERLFIRMEREHGENMLELNM